MPNITGLKLRSNPNNSSWNSMIVCLDCQEVLDTFQRKNFQTHSFAPITVRTAGDEAMLHFTQFVNYSTIMDDKKYCFTSFA